MRALKVRVTGFLRLFAYGAACLVLIPAHVLFWPAPWPWRYTFARLLQRVTCRIFAIDIHVEGEPACAKALDAPVLYVCNHLSYWDIPVLGSLLPANFIAKSDVKHWPFFGVLARLGGTRFIRRDKSAAGAEIAKIGAWLDKDRHTILFPEGTSTDGRGVAPLKSSFFGFLEKYPGLCWVQPVTLRLRDAKSQFERDHYAWYGDMDLIPHLWAFACHPGAKLSVRFHATLDPRSFGDRKSLCRHLQQQIESGLWEGPENA